MGIDVTLANWRGIIGSKGMTNDQIAFWEKAFFAAISTDEWKAEVEKNLWTTTFAKSAESRRFLENEDHMLRNVLVEIGVVKSWLVISSAGIKCE